MWGTATQVWLDRPFTGQGPGAFPWLLQTTDHFNGNAIHPRHPDSAIFQLLPEAGLLGVAAAGLLLVGVGFPMLAKSRAAALAVAVFAFGGLAGNPTDFPFLIATALASAAYALPRPKLQAVNPHPVLRWVSVAGFALVAVAVASTLVEESITTLQQGASALATSQAPGGKRCSLAFDPKMAIYARQRGIASLLLSEPAAAIADLQLATALNPNDDFRWRGLPPLRRGRRTMGPQLARAWIARLPSSGLTSRACSFPPPGTSRTTTLRRTSARRLRSSWAGQRLRRTIGWLTSLAPTANLLRHGHRCGSAAEIIRRHDRGHRAASDAGLCPGPGRASRSFRCSRPPSSWAPYSSSAFNRSSLVCCCRSSAEALPCGARQRFFFQLALLAGYAYSYVITRFVSPRYQPLVHLPILVLPILMLPLSLPLSDSNGSVAPAIAVIQVLAVGVGVPFVVAATTGPLLQRWFSFTGHRDASDPYFLYAASNTGSLLVLVAYPFLIEPRLTLSQQSAAWSVGYVAFACLSASCAVIVLELHAIPQTSRLNEPAHLSAPGKGRNSPG